MSPFLVFSLINQQSFVFIVNVKNKTSKKAYFKKEAFYKYFYPKNRLIESKN